MDRYQKVEKPKADSEIKENELRITAQGRMRNYISYAISLLQDKGANEIILKATGRAINKTVMIAELVKRRIVGLHQHTLTGSIDITDTWEPLEEGLLPIETTRHVSIITITLSKEELDTSSIGYQPPIPADQVKPSTDFEGKGGGYNNGEIEHRNGGVEGGRGYGNRGRGRGSGRGRSFHGRGRGYGGGNMQNDSGYYNDNGESAPTASHGRGFHGRGRSYGGGNMQNDSGYYNGDGESAPIASHGRGRGRGRGRARGRGQGFRSNGPSSAPAPAPVEQTA